MIKRASFTILSICLFFALTGCSVKAYSERKDRVDQDLSGNRGYMAGTPKEAKDRKATRKTYTVEMEMASPSKLAFWRKKEAPKKYSTTTTYKLSEGTKTEDQDLSGNRGYVTGTPPEPGMEADDSSSRSYAVQKGDTLQKISSKFFGTTRRWTQIYKFNKRILKSPDSIYPGQKIRIPGK